MMMEAIKLVNLQSSSDQNGGHGLQLDRAIRNPNQESTFPMMSDTLLNHLPPNWKNAGGDQLPISLQTREVK